MKEKMRNMKIGRKIALGFGAVISLTGLLAVIVLVTGGLMNSNMTAISDASSLQAMLNRYLDHINEGRVGISALYEDYSEEEYARAANAFKDADAAMAEALSFIEEHRLTEFKPSLQAIEQASDEWKGLVDDLAASGQFLEVTQAQFDSLSSAAVDLAYGNIARTELDHLRVDILSDADTTELYFRLERIRAAASLLNDIVALSSVFHELVYFHDLSEIESSIDYGNRLLVTVDHYIEESGQDYNDVFAQNIKFVLDSYLALINEYSAEIRNKNSIVAKLHAQETSVYNEINETLAMADDLQADHLDGTTMRSMASSIITSVIALIVLIFGFTLARALSSDLSDATDTVTRALSQVGMKGSLRFDEKLEKEMADCATRNDEMGECTRALRKLLAHLNGIEDTLKLIADGNFAVTCETLSDEDKISLSVTEMLDNLRKMMGEILETAAQVAQGSDTIASKTGNISQGAQSLAVAAKEQAAAVTELLASIDDIKEQIGKNTRRSDLLKTNVTATETVMETSMASMRKMSEAMKAIDQSSQEITSVISVVKDIADQTNLLALNASIEAARAGEAGKGFAVVASEISKLASQSAEAVTQTTELIQNSSAQTNHGLKLAEQTYQNIQASEEKVKEMDGISQDMTRSLGKQSRSIEEINNAAKSVSAIIETNAAVAEESAVAAEGSVASTEEMAAQAAMLSSVIGRFKLA